MLPPLLNALAKGDVPKGKGKKQQGQNDKDEVRHLFPPATQLGDQRVML
jgi:hypothetical protein